MSETPGNDKTAAGELAVVSFFGSQDSGDAFGHGWFLRDHKSIQYDPPLDIAKGSPEGLPFHNNDVCLFSFSSASGAGLKAVNTAALQDSFFHFRCHGVSGVR